MSKKTKRATNAELEELHGELCRVMTRIAKVYKTCEVSEIQPTMLNAVRQFLKDNSIEGGGIPENKDNHLGALAEAFNEDDLGFKPNDNLFH